MAQQIDALKTEILIPLQVPIPVTDAEGKTAKRDTLTLHRPDFKQAKMLAVVIGPQFIKALMSGSDSKDNNVDTKELVIEIINSISTKEGLDGLTAIIADMAQESPQFIDKLDWLDLFPVVTAFLDFFPALQSIALSKLGQT